MHQGSQLQEGAYKLTRFLQRKKQCKISLVELNAGFTGLASMLCQEPKSLDTQCLCRCFPSCNHTLPFPGLLSFSQLTFLQCVFSSLGFIFDSSHPFGCFLLCSKSNNTLNIFLIIYQVSYYILAKGSLRLCNPLFCQKKISHPEFSNSYLRQVGTKIYHNLLKILTFRFIFKMDSSP